MKLLGRLTTEQMNRYKAQAPSENNVQIRRQFNVPSDRYFTVSTWPDSVAGNVWLDEKRTRVVPVTKISKSDQ